MILSHHNTFKRKAFKAKVIMKNLRSHHTIKPSYIREILQAATNTEVISLAGGLPAESSFPVEIFREATSRLLDDPTALQYSTTEGEHALRHWVAKRHKAESSQILITNGAQQAMDLVARTFIEAGDKVVVEVPAYLGALQVFQLARANIISIVQTPTGPDLEQLESAFQQRPKLFYAVPDFHNPTGCCWTGETRREVVNLAEKYGVMIMEDAPYRELRYSGLSLPSLYELAPEQVCHIGSFSKVAAPGLRLGFLCAGSHGQDQLISQVALVKQATDLHSSTFCQRLLLSYLKEPLYSSHIHKLQNHYRHRRDTLISALQRCLGSKVNVSCPEGGMFLWPTLPGVNTDELAKQALKKHVAIVPGSVFYPNQAIAANDKMRLNFTHATADLLIEGVERLSGVINTM